MRRLLSALKRRFNLTEEISVQPDDLREALPLWLARTVGQGRITLVFDALNQVEGEERDRRLDWLPRYFPPHVSVLCSALPGPALNALAQRGWPTFELRRPDPGQMERMINAFLGHYRKTLPDDLRHRLASAPQAANPLYLRTVLEELRQFGKHEELADCLDGYLGAADPMELFRRVVQRWRKDFDARERQLAARALTHLWAAKQGLAEAEWLELLEGAGEPLPRGDWTPLFLAMEPHLSHRAGLYTFGHEYLRRAVEAELLPDPERQREAHLALADYFEAPPEMTPRKATEWPWQLQHAEQCERLERCLTNCELFMITRDDELSCYWLPLRALKIDMERCYRETWPEWEQSAPDEETVAARAGALSGFLCGYGLYGLVEVLDQRGLEIRQRVLGSEHPDTLWSLNELATHLVNQGKYDQAEPLLRRAQESCERILGPDHRMTFGQLNSLAWFFEETGDYAQAELLNQQVLESRERVLGPDHTDTLTTISTLAFLMEERGNYDQAEPLLRRNIENCERVFGPDHPETLWNINWLAVLLFRKGNYDESEPLFLRALQTSEQLLGPDHLDTLTKANDFGVMLLRKGDYDQAEILLRRALENRELILGPEHPHTLRSLHNLAVVLSSKGDYIQAELLSRRALESQRRLLGPEHPHTLRCLHNLAMAMKGKGDYVAAEHLFRSVLESHEEVLGSEHPDTLDVLNNLASLLTLKGDYTQAEFYLHRAMVDRERVLGPQHPDTVSSLMNFGTGSFATRKSRARPPICCVSS